MMSKMKSDKGVFLVEILIAMVILGVVGAVIFNSISTSSAQNKKSDTKAANITRLTSAAEAVAATPFLPCSKNNQNPYEALSSTIAPIEIAAIYAVTSTGTWSYCSNNYVSELEKIEGVASAWPATENASRIQKIILREPSSGLFRSVFKSFDNKLGNYGLGGSFKTIIQSCYNSVQVSECATAPATGVVTNITLDVGVAQTFKLAVVNPKNPANQILYFSTPGSSNKYSSPSIESTINGDLLTIIAPKFAADGTTKNTTGRGNVDIEAFDTVAALQATPIGLGISVYIPPFQAVVIDPSLTLIKDRDPGILRPVTYKGGFDPYTFADVSSSSLPSGMSFNSAFGSFSGAPRELITPARTYTVKFTDATSDNVSGSFSLQVVDDLAISNTVSGRTLYTGSPITAFNPFTTTGGLPAYTYSVNPALPAGLILNTSTGQISGTPTRATAIDDYTVTVVDDKVAGYVGQTKNHTFAIRVLAPFTVTTSVATKVVASGSAMSAYIPVTAAGGQNPYIYSVSPTLPAGLSLDTATGEISGTPAAASAATTYTVTVKDSISPTPNSATATFSLRVVTKLSIGTMITGRTFYRGTAITSFNANSSPSGGITPYTYSITPSLPAGLTLAASTGVISGTPTVESPTTTYTLKITDAAATGYVSQTGTDTFAIRVLAPFTVTTSVATKVVASGSAMSAYIPVTAAGGQSPYIYSVSPTLPAGLSLDTATGEISGTPAAASAATTYTVTVRDSISPTPNSAAATFSLQVVAPLSISNASSGGTFYVGVAGSLTPFTASGGATPYTYSISPSLTNGLSINTSTGLISGTPTAKLSSTSFTVTVNDASNPAVSKNATFNIRILDKLQVSAVMAYALKVGTAYTNLLTANVQGGIAPYSYSLTAGSLPAGLSFNTTTGAISGTPTKTAKTSSFTVTVNDSVTPQSNAGTATFTITVS